MKKNKILVISDTPFLPIKNGSNKAIYEYCNILKGLDCELYYCCYTNQPISEQIDYYFNGNVFKFQRSKLRKLISRRIFSKLRLKFCRKHRIDDHYPWGIEKFVSKLNNIYHFDICIINYITLSRIFKYINFPRKIIFTHDVFSNKLQILGSDHFWFNLSPNEEAKGLERCTDIIAIQENEAIFFHYLVPTKNVYTVYSSFPTVPQSLSYNNNILFIAGNNTLNYNGIKFFLDEVYPQIIKEIPSANLIIGGSICDALISKYSQIKGVNFVGRVENIDDFYKKGDIAINPIYQGTGLKIKTFEALSYGKITIVHHHSTEGIFRSQSAPLLIAETPEQFSELIILALKDYNLRKIYSESSLKYINELNHYVIEQYKKLLKYENS